MDVDTTSVAGVSLDVLLASSRRTGPAGRLVTGCTADWRRVEPGDVFVAVVGDDHDGHEDARRAMARGATAIVCERYVPVFHVPQYEVADSRIAWGVICQALAGDPSRHLRVIGVTGSEGKTTTLTLLASIFAQAGIDFGVMSGIQTYDGMTRGPGIGDTPLPEMLAHRLARMEAAGCTHALVEVSSQALAQHRLSGVQLDAACVTHVTSAHLDTHHTPHNYREAKRRILDLLGSEGIAILNSDNPVCCQWLSEFGGPSLTFGTGDTATVSAHIVERNACETIFLLTVGNETAAVRTSLVGDHHVADCLAAATTALAYDIDLTTIAAGIAAVDQLPARMQRVDCGQEFPLFVDAARTPDALRASLRTARQLATGRVICVLGNESPANLAEVAAVQGVVRKLADVVIVTDRRAQLENGWRETVSGPHQVYVMSDREEAMACAVSLASPADAVVVAGSDGRTDMTFGQTAQTPSDVETARQLLAARDTPILKLVA
jgi:UDP-N-acetylmuramoyl-L-alanyl-D-glutamate--2,6-diaminopimelate ligase